MSDDLRARMRAVFASKLPNSGKGALQRYSVTALILLRKPRVTVSLA